MRARCSDMDLLELRTGGRPREHAAPACVSRWSDLLTVAACERVKPAAFNIYNLGGTSTISLKDLIAAIEKTLGKKAVIEQQPMQPGDVPITFADITCSARDLGYKPTTSVEEGLGHFWKWFQEKA